MLKAENKFEFYKDVPGITKVAILLLALDQEASSAILRQLRPTAVEEVVRELADTGFIPQDIRDRVLEEFYELAMSQNWASEGGLDFAKTLLEQALPPGEADRVLQQISDQVRKTPFSFLQKADTQNLLTFIQDEHPQTIALIVSHMAHHKAAEILVGLSGPKQIEVVKRVANMEQTNPEIISEVEKGLEARLSNLLMHSFAKIGGVETIAEMMNLVDRTTEKGIMSGLEAENPDLVEQIRRLMFVFEDILLVNDRGIQSVLKEVDNDELALALKTASDDLKNKIFSNMSERAADLINEEMQFMGPVRVSDVEAAQQRIVDIVRRFEDAGEIIISGRGGEKEMIA
ncbi:MAG: flagellar motor switch protein FliG [Phycisphaeraceae bacterium]|nr:flagellar motor switch protein FliG [Phycisphaeraceae bacterium]